MVNNNCAAKGKPSSKIAFSQTFAGKPFIFSHQTLSVNKTSNESARNSTCLPMPGQ
jgi:hypothetical protein